MASFNMRFDLRSPGLDPGRTAALYAAALDMAEFADRNGFDAITLSEHHGADDGYLPSPLVMAAAIAARTERIRINIWAVPAAFHDPLRLAEDVAVCDVISGGRMGVAITNGYVPEEFAMFGRKLSERAGAVEETVTTLQQALLGEPFEFRGRTVRVTPRPVQRPRPPVVMGGASRPAARRAARIADDFVPSMPEQWDDYREARLELGHPDPGPMPTRGGTFHHVAHDPDAAWERVAPYCLHELNSYALWGQRAGAVNEYTRGDEDFVPLTDTAALRAMNVYPVLTPDQMVSECERVGLRGGLAFHPLCGGMDPDLAWESLRLFEQEVLPRLPG